MGTMTFGYYYDRGVKVGYNISYGGVYLSFVSSKDKSRIVRELAKDNGCKKSEIKIEKDSN